MQGEHHEPNGARNQKKWEIRSWLVFIQRRLSVVRKLTITNQFLAIAEKELIRRNFSHHEAKTAQAWIFYGNWQWKKIYQLELSDFYPTKEQLLTTGQKYIPLQIAQEREKQLMHTITRLRAEIERVGKANEEKQGLQQDDEEKKALRELAQKLTLKNLQQQQAIDNIATLIPRMMIGSRRSTKEEFHQFIENFIKNRTKNEQMFEMQPEIEEH